MKDDIFQKIATDIRFSWSVDDIAKNIRDDILNPLQTENDKLFAPVYMDPTGECHWQNFPTKISFARNFYRNFTNECEEVADVLRKIQSSIINSNSKLSKLFLSHEIKSNKVNLIKTLCGHDVAAHRDTNRIACINIGLKNSNTFRTHIIDNQDKMNFYNYPASTYTMNDGDAYLIRISNAHRVEALTPDNRAVRYLITYNITE